MKTRFYDHIDLRVKDRARAEQFYGELLPALGFTTRREEQEWTTHYAPGEGKPPFFGFTEDPNHQPNGTRISFWADSRNEVDRVAEIVRRAGGRNLEGPELVREYTPDYYAFFFEDPDGNKLEVCFRSPPNE